MQELEGQIKSANKMYDLTIQKLAAICESQRKLDPAVMVQVSEVALAGCLTYWGRQWQR